MHLDETDADADAGSVGRRRGRGRSEDVAGERVPSEAAGILDSPDRAGVGGMAERRCPAPGDEESTFQGTRVYGLSLSSASGEAAVSCEAAISLSSVRQRLSISLNLCHDWKAAGAPAGRGVSYHQERMRVWKWEMNAMRMFCVSSLVRLFRRLRIVPEGLPHFSAHGSGSPGGWL